MQCRHFGVCGGCSRPGVPYDRQLADKRARLRALLGLDVPPLLPSPEHSRFRQKVAFVFGQAGRRLVMGHYTRGTRQVIPVEECPVHSDRGNRLAFALRDHLARAGIAAAGSPRGVLRHLIVRTTRDDSEAVAMLVVTRNDQALRPPVRAFLASAERPDGFFINIHNTPGPFMVGPTTIRIDGRSHVRERALAADFLISPTTFFQTNVGAAGKLQELVAASLAGARRVLDLYSGSGLLSLPLARHGARVTAVEENRQAVRDLEANLRLNGMTDGAVRPICARVEDALARMGGAEWDAVILDPPREGCTPAVLRGVFADLAPPRAVYVSCHPEALQRELPIILKAGYQVTSVQAVDMFPHTDHIEVVVGLARRA